MNFQFSRNIFLCSAVFLALCSSAALRAQTNEETEVSIVKKFGSRYSKCFIKQGNAVIDEAEFKEISGTKCPELQELLKVDFARHTLITYLVGGDCFIRAKSRVARHDAEKKFTVAITNYWGGCRAGGSIRGWIVIDKIPPGYTIEFSETRDDGLKDTKSFETDDDIFSPKQNALPKNFEYLPTREIDLKGCIQMFGKESFVIRDKIAFQAMVRKDASRERCLKDFEEFDFEKASLLGININSGYCRRPPGLDFQSLKDRKNKKITLKISYIDSEGAICRALSRFDLWVSVPKIPEGFKADFEIEPKKSAESGLN